MWDDPADGVTRYNGVPQGYSVYLNGMRAFTVDRLTRVLYDPATGAVTLPSGGTVTYNATVPGYQAPQQVVQNSARMVDIFAKAGVDLTDEPAEPRSGFRGLGVLHRVGHVHGAAVDGFPTNEPIWGSSGSPNGADWFEFDFGAGADGQRGAAALPRRPRGQPLSSALVVHGAVLERQCVGGRGRAEQSPGDARPNYNVVRFTPVSTQRLRVQMTHANGFKTGLTEVKVHQR